MSLRVIHIDKKKNDSFKKNEKKKENHYDNKEQKNRNIPKADIDMLVLDQYEKEFER